MVAPSPHPQLGGFSSPLITNSSQHLYKSKSRLTWRLFRCTVLFRAGYSLHSPSPQSHLPACPRPLCPSLTLQLKHHCPMLPDPVKRTLFLECRKTSSEIRAGYGRVPPAFVA